MKLIVTVRLLLVCLLFVGCIPAQNFDVRLSAITEPSRFSFFTWEVGALWHELKQLGSGRTETVDDDAGVVAGYFDTVSRIRSLKPDNGVADDEAELNKLKQQRAALKETVESVISRQLREILNEQGIFNPLHKYMGLRFDFPPVSFNLEKPPHLLVVSPRDKIESIREIT
ncbi:hypothetical protein ACFLUE_03035, partial [Chloroflexota bacterium]